MKDFTFRKTTKRNNFTIVFGGVGKRRRLFSNYRRKKWAPLRFKMQKIRRAHQGYRNQVYGSISALLFRKEYGRRKPIAQFRR
jgi:hypothetical protein